MSVHRSNSSSSISNLPATFNEPVQLAIIGGTGLYHLDSLTPVARLTISTPWGFPSSPVTISKTESGFPIAFLARHGFHHDLLPTEVPNQANIAALKSLGVKVIVAFSAVGSLKQEIKPRDFVLPNQIIDRTKGIRPSTFFEKGFVAHAGFGEPFDPKLIKIISKHQDTLDNSKLHYPDYTKTNNTNDDDVILICMEGPAFSTRAESRLYKSWGGSVINMSCIPESKLAREAEISYQMVCMSTDYDAWNINEEPVTVETVVGNLKANSANANRLATAIIPSLEEAIKSKQVGNDLNGVVKMSLSTGKNGIKKEVLHRMHFLFPGYWPADHF
ncbi:S-methyl-5-thioadenosine phosphorylase [Ascoidea rubescens DSM 1968]|uniref:S-methyl-5'-thioadenosine phosphorylase n=1 Tax=Ascoidea rubescens DSM 1968 TaxID=1344418 RepID=A0A1D2VNQ0_9ASCO|nr:putative methylthioadenosine phosphorylase [Ascoidea rubescens DSM 1968]ODV63238.1 putative methylthioadenosine phosphorylase [Ascoidea rubescens DSM 1968]